tara:strand:+ start:56 stop:1072 length:1017 start_codon:yes stop_codon:yes gene_type:complete
MNIKQIIEEAYFEAVSEAGAFYGGFPPNLNKTPRPNLSERIAIEDAEQSMIDLVTKKFGKTHEQDFFSDDYSSYFKYVEADKDDESGSVQHKVYNLPSFTTLYFNLSDAVDNIKDLVKNKEVAENTKVRELFEAIKKTFRATQSTLRKEFPAEYDVMRRIRSANEEVIKEEEEVETEGAELPDATDEMLQKFPTLKKTIVRLMTDDFKEFVGTIDYISPRPTAFRVNLTNGQSFTLKWMGKNFEATILGKRYYLGQLSNFQQALDKLSILYKEGPVDKPEDELEGGAEGGAGFNDAGGAAGGEGGGLDIPDAGGDDIGGEDLGDEDLGFEEPGEEPEA